MLQAAFRLTRQVELLDSDAAKAYRARYRRPPAAPPDVAICDTISSDTWWHGAKLAEAMAERAKLATDGAAEQEDNAALTALERAAAALLDFARVAVPRTASNFDREAPGQSAAESLGARSGGYVPSVVNAISGRRRARPRDSLGLADLERRPAKMSAGACLVASCAHGLDRTIRRPRAV